MLENKRARRVVVPAGLAMLAVLVAGCGAGDGDAPGDQGDRDAASAEILEGVPSMDEASEAADVITAEDADEALSALERELESEGG